MKTVRFGAGKLRPSKIVCVGRNYAAHLAELNNAVPDRPVLFIKPNSAIATQVRSRPGELLHYEAEITLLIEAGRMAGVGFGLDLTRRELQSQLKGEGLPWERAKAFDGSAVFGGFVPFRGDPSGLRLEFWINDRQVQAGGVALMLTKPAALLAAIGADFTLEDGDLVMTGTPAGVGPVVPGDRYVGRIFDADRLLTEAAWTVL